MRSDMRRVIIDTGRSRSSSAPGIKTHLRIRRVKSFEADEFAGDSEYDFQDVDSPTKLGNREKHFVRMGYKTFGDRTGPLSNFLINSVGKKWDDVWSEICASNDNRSIDGYHLRQHVIDYVVKEHRYRYNKSLFVDNHGILRVYQTHKHKNKIGEIKKISITETFGFEKKNGFWFENRYLKHLKGEICRSFVTGDGTVSYFYQKDELELISSKQVGKKIIKKINALLVADRSDDRHRFTNPILLVFKDKWDQDEYRYVDGKLLNHYVRLDNSSSLCYNIG